MVVNKSIIKPILNTNGKLMVSFHIPNPDIYPNEGGKTTNILSLLILLYDEKFDKLVGEDKYIIPYFSFIAKYVIDEFTSEYREDISKFVDFAINNSFNPTNSKTIEHQFLDLLDKFKKTFFNKFFWGIDISGISTYGNEINQILQYVLTFAISNQMLSNMGYGQLNINDVNNIRRILGRLVGHLIVDVNLGNGAENEGIEFTNVYRLVKGGIKDIVRKFFVSYYLRYHYLGNFLGFLNERINRGVGLDFLEYSILNRFGFSLDTITDINQTDKSTLEQILQNISLAPISLYIEIPIISVSTEILSQLLKSKSSTPILQYIKSKIGVDFSKISFLDLLDVATKYISQKNFNLKFTGYLIDTSLDNIINDMNNLDNVNNGNNKDNSINDNVNNDIYERYFDFKILNDFMKYLKIGEGLISNSLDIQDINYTILGNEHMQGGVNNYEVIKFQPKFFEEFYLIDRKQLGIDSNKGNNNEDVENDKVKQSIKSLLPFAQVFETIKNNIVINQLFKA